MFFIKVVIDLTKNFKTNLANKLLARYRRQLYELYRLDFAGPMTVHVLFSLPKDFDLYRTLKGAVIEYSPERMWLRLNIPISIL